MSKRAIAIVLMLLFTGCTIESIDAVKSRQLKVCETITDERIRMECVLGVEPESSEDLQ